MKRDILIGIIAGTLAIVVMNWRRAEPFAPPGIYQAMLDQSKYREMEETFAPPSFSAMETRRRLETRIEKFELKDARFDWIIDYLADASGVDIDVEWSHLKDEAPREWTISLNLYDVSVIQALQEVLETVGRSPTTLGMRVEPGRVLVSLADRLNKEQVTRVYDVRDLLRAARDPSRALRTWKGPPATLPSDNASRPHRGPADWLDGVVTEQHAVRELMIFVQEHVDPVSWRGNGGRTSMHLMAGKLIIVQSRENQDRIAILLDWMREVLR